MASDAKQQASGEANLLWALMIITLACALAAFATYWICDYVVEGFSDSNTMALLITDAGTKSDDANLERQLTTATLGLKACRDLGWALSVGCVGVGVAVFLRFRRQNAS